MNRRIFSALTLSAIALASAASIAPAKAEDVTIGAIEILTGPNARYGVAIKNGLDLALTEVNKTGILGGKKLAIQYEDSAGNKDQAVNAARKLIGLT